MWLVGERYAVTILSDVTCDFCLADNETCTQKKSWKNPSHIYRPEHCKHLDLDYFALSQ